MSIGSDPDGGYTVIPEFDEQIRSLMYEVSPMRQICTVKQIGTNALKTVVEQSCQRNLGRRAADSVADHGIIAGRP